jgi:NhaP-type Na+/H+ or K+/H+ antiporter
MYLTLAVLALFAFLYSVVARRLDRTPVNGALVYLVFGLVIGPVGLGIFDVSISNEGIGTVAELTLALVLFTDAANADLAVLRRSFRLPQRLLMFGLPLTILLGFGTGVVLLPELGLLEVAILATMLAPTDAALGKAVVGNAAVPAPVREGLNVESGLNDGICVPILFTLLALAGGAGEAGELALSLLAQELGIGLLVGVGLAAGGAQILRLAVNNSWFEAPWEGIPIVALAFACFALAQFAGGSGFIACFAGGLTFGALTREHKAVLLEGAEGTGEVFALVTWVIFGAAMVGQHAAAFVDWRVLVYAVLSLTVVRMLPVFVSVIGLEIRTNARLFLGWFGPRGLASIVFLVIVAQRQLPDTHLLVQATVATVVLSIVAHGLTANPLATAFGAASKKP